MKTLSSTECTIVIGALRVAAVQYEIDAQKIENDLYKVPRLVGALRQQAKDANALADRLED